MPPDALHMLDETRVGFGIAGNSPTALRAEVHSSGRNLGAVTKPSETRSNLKHRALAWDDHIEANLARGWLLARGESKATWEQAKPAVHDAWERACGRGEC